MDATCFALHPGLLKAKQQAENRKHSQAPSDIGALYQVAVGTLQWFARTTHPEIAYSVGRCVTGSGDPSSIQAGEVIDLLQHCCQGQVRPRPLIGSSFSVEQEQQAINGVGELVLKFFGHLRDQTTLEEPMSKQHPSGNY